jgi:hypothetical protein
MVASVGLHVIPFFRGGSNPLGYDTGFYRRYLTQPFLTFPNVPVPGLGSDAIIPRIIFDVLRFIQLPTDLILYGSYIFLFATLPVLAYYFLRASLGTRFAFGAGMLIILSSVSYNAYWYFLWKNALGIDLILLALIALDRRSFYWLLVLDAAIALSHTTSAIVYILTLCFLFCIWSSQKMRIFCHGALTALLLAFASSAHFHAATVSMPVASFLEWSTYLSLSAPLLLLMVCTLKSFSRLRIPLPLLAFTLASFTFPIFHLPFYERLFVFSDVALALCAAYGLKEAVTVLLSDNEVKKKSIFFIILCISLGLLLGSLWNQITSLNALVSNADIQEIGALNLLIPTSSTLLTTSDMAPWYEGWTDAHVAAPGLLHDTHNQEKWTAFWDATSTNERIAYLGSFPQPLYISTLGNFSDLIGMPIPCLVTIAPHLIRDECSLSMTSF